MFIIVAILYKKKLYCPACPCCCFPSNRDVPFGLSLLLTHITPLQSTVHKKIGAAHHEFFARDTLFLRLSFRFPFLFFSITHSYHQKCFTFATMRISAQAAQSSGNTRLLTFNACQKLRPMLMVSLLAMRIARRCPPLTQARPFRLGTSVATAVVVAGAAATIYRRRPTCSSGSSSPPTTPLPLPLPSPPLLRLRCSAHFNSNSSNAIPLLTPQPRPPPHHPWAFR